MSKSKIVISGKNNELVDKLDKHLNDLFKLDESGSSEPKDLTTKKSTIFKHTESIRFSLLYPDIYIQNKDNSYDSYGMLLKSYIETDRADIYIYFGDDASAGSSGNAKLILCKEKAGELLFYSDDKKIEDIHAFILDFHEKRLLKETAWLVMNYTSDKITPSDTRTMNNMRKQLFQLREEQNKNLKIATITLLTLSIASAAAAISIISVGTVPLLAFIVLAAVSISAALISAAGSLYMGLDFKELENHMQIHKKFAEKEQPDNQDSVAPEGP